MPRRLVRILKAAGVTLALLAALGLVVRTFVVPAVLAGRIGAAVGGRAEMRSWWLNTRSAGVVGLTLREGHGPGAPVWASAERVTTDLGLGKLLRGAFFPGRLTLRSPEVALRFDRNGTLLTKIGGGSGSGVSGKPAAIPVVIAEGAKVTIRQEGRPAMVVTGVTGRLAPDGDALSLAARSNDPNWGPVEAFGRFDPKTRGGRFDLKSTAPVGVTAERATSIPFVPPEVWDHVSPEGPVDFRLGVETAASGPAAPTPKVKTEILWRGTTLRSKSLDLTATGAIGRVVVDGPLVTFDKVAGRAIDGQVGVSGTLDFGATPAKFDLKLDIDHLDVAEAPKVWQLDEAGLTGRLTGKAHLLAALKPGGVDLTGSTGGGVVENGRIQGIPFKSIKLAMKAEGDDLRYEAKDAPAGSAAPVGSEPARPVGTPEAPGVAGGPPPPKIQLPKSLTTRIELEDVDVSDLVRQAQFLLGYPFPVPITGRLSVNADATIPLGQLKSFADYAFHGDLVLKGASVYNVDLGRLASRVDLDKGVLVLKDFRGRLVDRPDGGPDNPPEATAEVPVTGPLPVGGFRGTLTAEIVPAGKLSARFEGNTLPLGELSAPVLPRPTPLSGRATLEFAADADLGRAADPAAWTVTGTVRSRAIKYHSAALDGVAARVALKGGRLDVDELTATLRGRPLAARLGLDLKPPQAFSASVDVTGWGVEDVLAWVPDAPTPAPAAGALTARALAEGTLAPFALTTRGEGRFDRLRVGPVGFGDLPFHWTTRGDAVDVAVTDARPFGGRVTAEAVVPLKPGRPVAGSARIEGVDAAAVSAAVPGGKLAVTGRASGELSFSVPHDVSALDASVKLSAPDLTVQGVPVERLRASVRALRRAASYELNAESLGGRIKFTGSVPLGRTAGAGDAPLPPALPTVRSADGEFRAAGFELAQVWKALGLAGAVSRLGGRGAIDANVRAVLDEPGSGLYAHGLAEVRGLTWHSATPVGRLRGVIAVTPRSWRVDQFTGDLLGGSVGGAVWGGPPPAGSGRPALGYEFRVERASLKTAVEALAPTLGVAVEGVGTARFSGTINEAVRANGDIQVGRAKVAGLAITDLRLPAELVTSLGGHAGVLTVRRWSARVAGGTANGNGRFRLGEDRSFQTEVNLAAVDLESIARVESAGKPSASGKVSGKVTLSGSDPTRPRDYRGRADLDLDDASLMNVPVVREIDRLLGSSRGGVFDDGDLSATIGNGEITVESLTLVGRLAQLHITGTVGFDGQLDMGALVNTSQIVSETGQALVGLVPGLSGARGRDRQAAGLASFLSSRLLKFRIAGTVKNPTVNLDPGVGVGDSAVNFFAGVFRLPGR